MAANPYTPPKANVADISSDELQEPRIFAIGGRIGRLRYLAYMMGAWLIFSTGMAIVMATLGPEAGATVTLLGYIPFIVVLFMFMIQRSHDMDWSGWMCLLSIIPFVGLIWLFKAGTPGENRWGPRPTPNTTGVKVLAFLLPAIAIIGILAAIALPAYQQYVERERAEQSSQ